MNPRSRGSLSTSDTSEASSTGKRGGSQELTEDADSQPQDIGAERDSVAPERLEIAGMFGSIERKPLVAELMGLLDRPDRLEQDIGR